MGKMYLAMELSKSAQTNLGPLKLSWNDGQIGAIPVFATKTAARKAYGRKVKLVEIAKVEDE